jgi:flagellar basal-body rod protein FlgB
MQSVNLFGLASTQARWLSARQTAVAGNIANANTTGYVGRDVVSFDKVLNNTQVTLASTNPGHTQAPLIGMENQADATTVMPSGNTVVVEDELVKAGEVRRGMEMNTAIVKAFHRMIMLSAKV